MRRVVPISTPTWRRSSRSSGMKNASSSAHLRFTSRSSAACLDPLRPDREEGLHRLDEGGEGEPIGERGALGNVDRPEGGNRIGNDAALRQSRQIFVLADEARFRVGARKAKLRGEHRGECGAWIIVGADDRGDVAIRDRGADARDFGDRICGAVEPVALAADQLFEARARIVMKQIVEAGTGKSRQLPMVAKGRADNEHGAAPRAGRRTFLREILHQSASRPGTRINGLT